MINYTIIMRYQITDITKFDYLFRFEGTLFKYRRFKLVNNKNYLHD